MSPRARREWNVWPRTMPSGLVVWYVYTYDAANKRRPKSTGKLTKTAAEAWVQQEIARGTLLTGASMTFARWAENWWIYDKCPYIRYVQARGGQIGKKYAYNRRNVLVNHLLPAFGTMRLDDIGPHKIEAWIDKSIADGASPDIINQALQCLKTMLGEAVRVEQLRDNRAAAVRPLRVRRPEKGILTIEETRTLFDPANYARLWRENNIHYTLSIVAASTGLRVGEILALTVDCIYPTYISLSGSWNPQYKTVVESSQQKDHSRRVPIPARAHDCLQALSDIVGEGFIFIGDEDTPITTTAIRSFFYSVLSRAGIDHKKRNITFHSWRHWFNAIMRGRVDDVLLRRVTGHKSEAMTDHYDHVTEQALEAVRDAQNKVFE